MRRPGRAAGGVLLAISGLLSAACSDETLSRGRSDAGLGAPDAGAISPLGLTRGMTFTYHAVLTYRDSVIGEERNGQYTLSLAILEVQDLGAQGESTLTFQATNSTTTQEDWDPVRDFDSWVSRLGPALSGDRVSTEPLTAELSHPPSIPPAPTPATGKRVPNAGTFFIDTRAIDAVSRAFLETHPNQNPKVIDPSQNRDRWRFAFDGPDATIFYYPDRSKHRAVALELDPRGFLVRLEETIGDTSMPPAATCRLELTEGP